MKPVNVKSSSYIDSSKENKHKEPKFKIGNIVRISKYKNAFAKCYTSNQSEEDFMIKKVKDTVPLTDAIYELNGEELIGTFYGNELQKTNQKEFRIEKVMKRKGDKLYVKWNGYNNSLYNWIDKEDLIKMREYFPKPNSLRANVKVKLDLSNYVTKANLKKATGVGTSSFAKKLIQLI